MAWLSIDQHCDPESQQHKDEEADPEANEGARTKAAASIWEQKVYKIVTSKNACFFVYFCAWAVEARGPSWAAEGCQSVSSPPAAAAVAWPWAETPGPPMLWRGQADDP